MKKKKINSKQKGNRGERDFINQFKMISGVELKRNYEQTANGGHDAIVANRCSELAKVIDDLYAIEIKRYDELTPSEINAFWEQAAKQARKLYKLPVLAFRENYRPWRMLIPLLWEVDETIEGAAEMSVLGFVKWVKWEAEINDYGNY